MELSIPEMKTLLRALESRLREIKRWDGVVEVAKLEISTTALFDRINKQIVTVEGGSV